MPGVATKHGNLLRSHRWLANNCSSFAAALQCIYLPLAVALFSLTSACSLKYHNSLTRRRCNEDIGDKSAIEDPQSDAYCADLNDTHPTGDECQWWTCNETTGFCEIQPTDKDGDEHIDQACAPEGATNIDCDDTNIARYIRATETCDYIDNNCDNQVDEGLAYGVSESHVWPFSDAGISNTPVNVNFATQSSAEGLVLAATFDFGAEQGDEPEDQIEAGVAVWSSIATDPGPFRQFDKRIILENGLGDGIKPDECLSHPQCGGESWLTTKNYYNTLPFTAGDDLGIVAAAIEDRYFAGLVQSDPTEALVRIHKAFHEGPEAGIDSRYATAAWTGRGLLVLGIKSCSGSCSPSGTSTDVFVHLLKKDDDTQAWTMASSTIDHHVIGKAPTADAAPVIVGLPSGQWITAHPEDSSDDKITLTLVKVTDETAGNIETSTVTTPELPSATDFTLSVGPTQSDTTTIALSYVIGSRAHVKLLALTEAPTPQATELVTLDAPIEDGGSAAHAKPLVAFHPDLAEWLFVWRDATSRLGMVRLRQDGTLIPNTFTHALTQEGRVLDQGFGLAPLSDPLKKLDEDSGAYALVTYAKDNTAPVFVTGAISCGIH